jgi:hypothetical protein
MGECSPTATIDWRRHQVPANKNKRSGVGELRLAIDGLSLPFLC